MLKSFIPLLLIAGGAVPWGDQEGFEVKPYVAWSGPHSRIEARGYFRIATDAEWTDLWLKHRGMEKEGEGTYDTFYNPACLPEIDFAKCMVLGIFQGKRWNSAGVACRSIHENKERILIRFDDKAYQTEGTGERAAPFGLFVLPASNKPIILEENEQVYNFGPPLWKEKARL